MLPVREYVETEAEVTLSSTSNVASVTGIKTSSVETCAVSWPHSSERKVIFSSAVDPTRPMRTRVCTTVSDRLYTLAGLSPVRSQSTP